MVDQVKEDTESLRRKVWDLGPDKPVAPVKPDQPKTDDAIAKMEYEEAAELYVAAIKAFRAQKAAYDRWREINDGPVQIEMWTVDLRDAIARAPGRYVPQLPKGVKPGKGHFANLARQEAEDAEFRRVAATDPIFGNVGAPA